MAKVSIDPRVNAMKTDRVHPDYIDKQNLAVRSEFNLPVIAQSVAGNAVDFTLALERLVSELTGVIPPSQDDRPVETPQGAIGDTVAAFNTISRCTERNNDLLDFLRARL